MLDDWIRNISKAIKRGEVAFFVGAGVNLCGRATEKTFAPGSTDCLPSGSELANHLADEYDFPWHDRRSDLLRVSEYAVVMRGQLSLYQRLHEVFDGNYEPTQVHRFVAGLPQRLRRLGCAPKAYRQFIVTTNYDDVMEGAFREAGAEIDVVSYIARYGERHGKFLHLRFGATEPEIIRDPGQYGDEPFENRSVLLKVHGHVRRAALEPEDDSYVITEDDYIDYLALNPQLPASIVSALKKKSLLFLGYSLSDWNMRVVLKRLWQEQPLQTASWAVMKDPSRYEEEFWSRRCVQILPATLEEFIAKLSSCL